MRLKNLVFVCLVVMLSGAARPVSGEEEYYAIFLNGKKVGHAIEGRKVVDGKVISTEEANMTIARMGISMAVRTVETSIETPDGKPLAFESVQDMSMMLMRTTGVVNADGTVVITSSSMGQEQTRTSKWPEGALMAEGARLLGVKNGLKEGLSYTVKVFSPSMQTALDAHIKVGAKRNVDLLGRVVALTEVVSTLNVPGAGQIVTTSYVDDDLRMQKDVTPMMGMQLEMVACLKDFALSENDVVDLVDKMFVPSPQTLENVATAKSITYQLSPIAGANSLNVISNDNQSAKAGGDGSVTVTVKPVKAAKGVKFPYKGADKAVLEAMKPTRYLQSDNKKVVALARQAVGGTKDAAEAARKIEAFAAGYIEKADLSIGYANAAEVADSRQGDCSEFAVLTASMCRAVGIPAQVVVGFAYVKDYAGMQDRFGGHAWVQAYIGGKWVGLDAAFMSTGRNGYGPGHIALASGNGNPEAFIALVGTMGQFEITKATVNR